ncbi:MAG: DUF192 domain-containing protein [Candidatus Absconditabacterales bacterium]
MKNNIKKKYWIGIGICFLILIVFYSIAANYLHDKNAVPQLCSEKKCFTVELARTSAETQQGLMYRESMAEDHGMLFIFSKSDFYDFRMKNTLIPLDMIWIDNQFKVVRILTVQPCKVDPCEVYRPEVFANYVVELNAGIAAKYGIVEGSLIKFQNIK